MAEFSNVATQTVAVNGNVLFTDAPTSVCNKGYISHRTGSGLINLKGATNTCKAKYRVEFNGNIAVPTGGTAGAISLAIAVEGEPDLSTLAISTPTAVEAFNNVSMATDVWLPCGCCQAISVKNTSAQAISVANANITVNRIGYGARVCTLKEYTKCRSVLQRKLSTSLKRALRMLTLLKWARSWI